jgi:hypothetical protein
MLERTHRQYKQRPALLPRTQVRALIDTETEKERGLRNEPQKLALPDTFLSDILELCPEKYQLPSLLSQRERLP